YPTCEQDSPPAEPVGEPAGEEVAGRFDQAEADQEGKDRCAAGEVKVVLGQRRKGRTLDSHHPADEGVCRHQERELLPVRAQPESDRLCRLHALADLRRQRSGWLPPPTRWDRREILRAR